MAIKNPTPFFILFFLSTLLFASLPKKGIGAQDAVSIDPSDQNLISEVKLQKLKAINLKRDESWRWKEKSARRLMIGSIAPTCTYNECRGCRFKCRAEQVPVDANDPINSAYRYRCVCHR